MGWVVARIACITTIDSFRLLGRPSFPVDPFKVDSTVEFLASITVDDRIACASEVYDAVQHPPFGLRWGKTCACAYSPNWTTLSPIHSLPWEYDILSFGI